MNFWDIVKSVLAFLGIIPVFVKDLQDPKPVPAPPPPPADPDGLESELERRIQKKFGTK